MTPSDGEPILWISIEEISRHEPGNPALQGSSLCVVLGYTTGWGVWDVTLPQSMSVMAEVRECGVKSAHFFPAPEPASGVPLLALISNGDSTAYPPQQVSPPDSIPDPLLQPCTYLARTG